MRIANRVLAVLFAVALLVLGLVVAIEVLLGALHRHHWLLPWESFTGTLQKDSWASGPARTTFLALIVVGLVLLVAELKPRRPQLLPLRQITPEVSAGTTRRTLQKTLGRAAAEVDGVGSATARVTRRTATVTAVAHRHDTTGLQERVTEHVTERLNSLDLAGVHNVNVTMTTEDKS